MKRFPNRLFLLVSVLLTSPSQAEYRVFVLQISPSEKRVQSTLDPEQYVGYYPLAKGEKITYIDTWRCLGRTSDFQPLCQKPGITPENQKPPTSEQGPSSNLKPE